jgi:simple sugar transport system ATP-binding protein/ribose transport system ATP-binding protein
MNPLVVAAKSASGVAPPEGLIHVELRGIEKRFGGTHALRGIDLAIRRGAIHGLVGENGAGKSTLGKIIAGVIPQDHGELLVDGHPVRYRSPRDALAEGTCLIAQEISLVPALTVLENVFLGAEEAPFGVLPDTRLRARYAELESQVGFDLPWNARVYKLSIARQQQVEILRALIRRARLIVMDEPTAALSVDESTKLFEVIRRLRDSGTTIVYVSHFLKEVLRLVDVVTVLKDGQLVRTSEVGDEREDTLIQAMTGRSIHLDFPPKRYPNSDAPVVLSVANLTSAAIHDVSFEVHAGEILGLAGLVGSGRSEVARCVFGVDRVGSGEVYVGGQLLDLRNPRTTMDAGVALLPESRKEQGLLMARPVTENISLAYLASVTDMGMVASGREERRVSELIRRVDVRARSANAPLWTLSGGNQQKVLFAKWIFGRPRVFIADEPTRGVDVGAKEAIYGLLVSLAAEGMAVLLISSELEEVLGLAHRVVVMRTGRIVARFDNRSLNEGDVLKAVLAGEQSTRGDAQ